MSYERAMELWERDEDERQKDDPEVALVQIAVEEGIEGLVLEMLIQRIDPCVVAGMIPASLFLRDWRLFDLTSEVVQVEYQSDLEDQHHGGSHDLTVMRVAKLKHAKDSADLELWGNTRHHLKQFHQFWAKQEEKLRRVQRWNNNSPQLPVEKVRWAGPPYSDVADLGSRAILEDS